MTPDELTLSPTKVAADGLMPLLEASDPPDPHLLLAVARALRDAGNDAYTSWLTRAAAPLALAAGEVEVWIRLVALGAQAASKSRRKLDLEFFLNEQHTSSLLRGDTVAAAAALAALGELLSHQHAPAPAATRTARHGQQGRRLIRHGRRALSVRHGAVAAVAIMAVTTGLVVATRPGPPTRQLAGTWTNSAGDTYHFAAGASNTYTASQVMGSSLHCYNANDITVTGNDGRYKGSIKLYPGRASSCPVSIGSGTITIVVAANGASAQVTTAGNDCDDCSTEPWNRTP